MVVLILERAPASVRGELTRWLLEVRPGVFVGTTTAEVRDRLWDHVAGRLRERSDNAAAVLVHTSETESGSAISVAAPVIMSGSLRNIVILRYRSEHAGLDSRHGGNYPRRRYLWRFPGYDGKEETERLL